MRGLKLLLLSALVLGIGIAVTVVMVESWPPVLLITMPVLFAAFFGVLQPIMWAMSRIGLPRPEPGVVPVGREEIERRLLALATDAAPFQVERLEDGRIVCGWKIADAEWYELFAKVKLRED